ncbi:espin-like protein [Pithys albifrons albifrons]|uniref:espin-like protein n=1 Tax=Pithys albifrons albifrons TaxID=3385563 RepID=UPI003A5CB284
MAAIAADSSYRQVYWLKFSQIRQPCPAQPLLGHGAGDNDTTPVALGVRSSCGSSTGAILQAGQGDGRCQLPPAVQRLQAVAVELTAVRPVSALLGVTPDRQPGLLVRENRRGKPDGTRRRRRRSPPRSRGESPRVSVRGRAAITRAGQGRTHPGRARPGPPGQGRAGQGRAEPDSPGQGRPLSQGQRLALPAERGSQQPCQAAQAGGAAGQEGDQRGGGDGELSGGAQQGERGAAQPQRGVQRPAQRRQVQRCPAAALPQQRRRPPQQRGRPERAQRPERPEQREAAAAQQQQRRAQRGQREAQRGQQRAQRRARQPLPPRQPRQTRLRLARPRPRRAQRAQPGPRPAARRRLRRRVAQGRRRGARAGGGGSGLRLSEVLVQLPAQVRHGRAATGTGAIATAPPSCPAAAGGGDPRLCPQSRPARRGMEPSRSVTAELKFRKPSQRAGIPAPFLAHPDGVAGPDPAEADADSLVPTHDERGRLIPEWKRQVMVKRLRARLEDEAAGGQDAGSWSFSPSHQAVLGPFGELLTEADLHQLEGAVESLRLRRRGEAYQGELRRLVRELRALLPAPLLSISVRSPPPAPGQPLPLWCGRLAGAVSSLAALLARAEGAWGPRAVAAAPAEPAEPAVRGQPREPAGSLAQREIRQCGVCVRSLRGAFEPAWGAAGTAPTGRREAEAASDSGISCEEALSDGGGSGPAPQWGSLRKERIVMLFLSHWRRSAYAPPPPTTGAPRGTAGSGAWGAARLDRQRAALQKLLEDWRDAASRRPPPPPPARALLSPEQFVSAAGGGPAEYESLSLELFMLGYFRILEQELPPDERRGRHLLCFEVFEQLGRHGWRAVRAFHRAVTDEIAAGRRGWSDGFDDIKARFFGSSHSPTQRRGEAGEEGQEMCRYIDRSFAFWKEKEAEIFRLEE